MNPRIVAASSLVVAALSSPCAALAQDTYQAEAGLSYSRFKSDSFRSSDAGADGTWFFQRLPSRPTDYPLEQAAFVERSGSLSANYSRLSPELTNAETVKKGSAYGVDVDFRRAGSPLILRAGYDSTDSGRFATPLASGGTETEVQAKAYQASIGAYTGAATALSVDWSKAKSRTAVNVPNTNQPDTNNTFTSVGLSGQHLARFAGGDSLAIDATIARITHDSDNAASETNWDIGLRATYYPTRMFGLSAGMVFDNGDDHLVEGKTYDVGARIFITPAFSVSLDYRKFKAKTPDNDFSAIALRGALRF